MSVKRGNLDIITHAGEMSCEHESRDRSDVSIGQGTPMIASNHQKVEERHEIDSPSHQPY